MALADPRASSVRPTLRDPGAGAGPPLSRGQALGNRRLAPRPWPANPRRRLILRQFLQTPPDRARRHAGCRRHRGNATITRRKRLRRGDQTTASLVEKRRYGGKILPDGINIDQHHNIWYEYYVENQVISLYNVIE